MIRRALWIGLALILAANAYVLSNVAYNRSGEPESMLALSERELTLPYDFYNERKENSGVALKVNWRAVEEKKETHRLPEDDDLDKRYTTSHTPTWLDADKLTSLGFRLPKLITTANATQLNAKEVLFVLELNGKAYEQTLEYAQARAENAQKRSEADPINEALKKKADSTQEKVQREALQNSRLFIIDAGLDAAALRQQYPDKTRYVLAYGRVNPSKAWSEDAQSDKWVGRILGLTVREVNVPVEWQPALKGETRIEGEDNKTAPFIATLAYGKRLEPWLVALTEKKTNP